MVVEGVIAYQANASGDALFKVKGVDEIQKVSTKYYLAEADYFFNWYKDEPTIEDLLTLAANKNDIELPSILKPKGYEFTTAERSKQVACYMMLGFALVNKPRVAAPLLLGSIVAKELKEKYDLKNMDCPTPKLKP